LQYIAMYSDIGQKSNTMIFSDRPADVNALLAQASTVVKAFNSSGLADSTAVGSSAPRYPAYRATTPSDAGSQP
jgi:hypothetical protein